MGSFFRFAVKDSAGGPVAGPRKLASFCRNEICATAKPALCLRPYPLNDPVGDERPGELASFCKKQFCQGETELASFFRFTKKLPTRGHQSTSKRLASFRRKRYRPGKSELGSFFAKRKNAPAQPQHYKI